MSIYFMTLILVTMSVLQDTTNTLPLCSYAQKETYSLPVIGIPTPRVSSILDKQGLNREGIKMIAVYSDSRNDDLALSFTANFDTLGRVTEEIFYKSSKEVPSSAEFFSRPYIRYDYLGPSNKISTQVEFVGTQVEFGKISVLENAGRVEIVNHYNSDGCLQRQEYYQQAEGEARIVTGHSLYDYKDDYYAEKTGVKRKIYTYIFNDNDALESYERYVPSIIGPRGDDIVQYGNIRVENGQVIEDVTSYVIDKPIPYSSGFLSIRYDMQGQVIQKNQFNINQDLVFKDDYQYNVQGNLINHTGASYDSQSGEITIIRVTNCDYTYDDRNNWTERVCKELSDRYTNTGTTVRNIIYY